MKKYKFITAVLLAAALCGCSNKDNSSQNSTSSAVSSDAGSSIASNDESGMNSDIGSSGAESSAAGESTGESPADPVVESKPQSDDESFLVGLAGDRILKSEITTVFTSDGSDCAPADLTEEKFSAVLCDGFAYVAEPSKLARNDRDNEDSYDSANMQFTDITSEPVKNYKRLNVGDTICGLTLKEAQVNFARGSEQMSFEMKDGSQKTGAELGLPEIFFSGSSAKFDGEMSMTGYICRIASDVYGVGGVGDIVFVPSDGEANFPVMSYRLGGDDGFYHISQMYSASGLTWQNEFGFVALGNVNSTTADVSELAEDGSFVKACVTVDNFELNCGVNFINTVKADIIDIEIL